MGSTGVTVGKFNPPHLGHLHLIQKAAAQVDQLFVLVCAHPGQSISGEQRRAWLFDASPSNVTMLVTPDDLPAANEPWARRTLELLPTPPNVAFTSEDWGEGWAALMGAVHHSIDLARTTVPISATEIRSNVGANFRWLVPAARRDLARRVVLIGAESTGKSTLAEALARELKTVWVPECGRWYWEGRRYLEEQSWTSEEFRSIAQAQRQLEDCLARRSTNGLVIADTDALVTAVWHERYLRETDPVLDAMLPSIAPSLYLICDPDFPWVQDGTRESKHHRRVMHELMLRRAQASGTRVEHLRGAHDERLAKALVLVESVRRFPRLT